MLEKTLLIDLCNHLQNELNKYSLLQNEKIVEFISIQRTQPIAQNQIRRVWSVEIWFDKQPLIREHRIMDDKEDAKEVEKALIIKILRSTFTSGILSFILANQPQNNEPKKVFEIWKN